MSGRLPVVICGFVLLSSGCTAKQIYESGQGLRQNECYKIANENERSRCNEDANKSYEKYKRERDEAIK
jgi:hypothetical protein